MSYSDLTSPPLPIPLPTKTRFGKPSLLRWLFYISLFLFFSLGPLTFAVLLLARLGGSAVAMQYGQSAPKRGDIYYFAVDVERALRVRQDQPLDTTPATNREIAPDGRRVLSAQQGGNIDLFIVGTDGGWQRLTHFSDFSSARTERVARRANLYPAWSPDGQWIAFISSDINGRLALYAVRPGTAGLHKLGDQIRVVEPFPPRWIVIPAAFLGEMLAALTGCIILLWLFISRFYAAPAANFRA